MAKPDDNPEHVSIAKNRRARHDYAILDTYEAGLVLQIVHGFGSGRAIDAVRSGL